jgi:nucleotide-binding universal stress UspA family protein
MRRSYEAGHVPKLLVLVDESADCDKAIYYAVRRAARLNSQVVLLRVIEPPYPELDWLGVSDVVRAEAHEEAHELLDRHAVRAREIADASIETCIQEGDPAEQIFELIRKDDDIALLVLAAGSTEKGPGRLVSDLARTAGTYPVPVVIVPAHLSDLELVALS